ncbi:nucleoside triphosphate pyrophosphohydrolase [Actinoplanes derwentensis]|uniref:Predicted house-cleaning noncanonical NTP pyrophosphatase, all-alpha NTP-PPase (MazG) superfamily n=1 Tax=Actinoplanes derwentensis TaxID=113562 RepID=A0A1H1WNS9_9ACTN|nr:nucleoside triphosphate pyrophosphohydrolase [Actinoplanes derwentensis]GID87028.1 phosphoribosyl-ATP pyrophosphohydrolase [Actinoplanes derwentensis]SDS98927.1 Predicted house-cleaning noncanonical NTP pyrophosphatase, all-alpha NTP-PPase (MazG) superfamily [Actinoplanes derwentensis]
MSREQKIVYGKLVRDRIPEIISADGRTPRVRVLEAQELLPALIAKLHEEAEEVASAEPGERLGELADIREVVAALTVALGFTEAEVDEAAAAKRAQRGGFTRRLWLDEVLVP